MVFGLIISRGWCMERRSNGSSTHLLYMVGISGKTQLTRLKLYNPKLGWEIWILEVVLGFG